MTTVPNQWLKYLGKEEKVTVYCPRCGAQFESSEVFDECPKCGMGGFVVSHPPHYTLEP